MNVKSISLLDILQIYEVSDQHLLPQISLMTLLKLRSANKSFKQVCGAYFCNELEVKAFVENVNSSLILLKNGRVLGTGYYDTGGRVSHKVPVTKPVEFFGLPKISAIGIGCESYFNRVFYFKKDVDNEVLCNHMTDNWGKIFEFNSNDKPDFSSCDQFQKAAADNPEVVNGVYEKYSDIGFFKVKKTIQYSFLVGHSFVEKDGNKNSSITDGSSVGKPSPFIP